MPLTTVLAVLAAFSLTVIVVEIVCLFIVIQTGTLWCPVLHPIPIVVILWHGHPPCM